MTTGLIVLSLAIGFTWLGGCFFVASGLFTDEEKRENKIKPIKALICTLWPVVFFFAGLYLCIPKSWLPKIQKR